jgi:subtilisin family serine protease
VTDDGCKLDHQDFNSTGKFAAWGYFRGERLVNNTDIDAQPGEMYKSGSNHGTSCAGVIAGEADAVLTVGAAPGCRLLPIQWESDGPFLMISDSKLLTALNFVANKVDVFVQLVGQHADHALVDAGHHTHYLTWRAPADAAAAELFSLGRR